MSEILTQGMYTFLKKKKKDFKRILHIISTLFISSFW